MRRKTGTIIALLTLIALRGNAQADAHYTMFMFNKLFYNPAYAGMKGLATINATYRNQWSGMPGAPKTFNVSIDAPLGRYTSQLRPAAVGLVVCNEELGVEKYTTAMGNYAYRIPVGRGILSAGLRAGAKIYSANYSQLDVAHKNDPNFQGNIAGLVLPNAGAGLFWSAKDQDGRDKYFAGLSIPMLLQNRYGDNTQNNTVLAREIRCGYLAGGYVVRPGSASPFTFTPQVMVRFLGDFNYRLPINCDLNITATYQERLMLGITYRTDRSVEFITHIQVLQAVNIGYAYDNSFSPLSPYLGQTHELLAGFDIVKIKPKYPNPRFMRSF